MDLEWIFIDFNIKFEIRFFYGDQAGLREEM